MPQKLTKDERKILKKQKKSQETLLRHENIICSNEPTKYLLVANGGLLNGLSREVIYTLFINHGNIANIHMKQNKPYCFVEYCNVSEAEQAVQQIHGKELEYFHEISRPGLIFYISYVDEVAKPMTNTRSCQPPGLTILKDFILPDEELQLMESLEWEADESIPEDQLLKHRKVKHFGFKFDYKANKIDKENPLGGFKPGCEVILHRLMELHPMTFMPDQLTVNQYQPGQGIPPHVDSHSSFEDDIIIISLGSQTIMDFKNVNGDHYPVLLPVRSVAIMSGDCRYMWTHGMTPRMSDVIEDDQGLTLVKRGVRTSFTFRKVRISPCSCGIPTLCDSQREQNAETSHKTKITDEDARHLESEHVYKVYNEIADHFSNTRHTPWPRVTNFLESLEPGSLVLDVGCGNGKYLGTRKGEICMIGCDASEKLCEINATQNHEVQMCNILNLPYLDDAFDAAICIAVVHHLASQERREASLKEICRVVRPGGRILIYVWAMEQQRNGVKSNYLKKPEVEDNENLGATEDRIKLPVHRNGTEFKSQDTLVPWHLRACNEKEIQNKGDSKVCHRFYHVFTEGELESLCHAAGMIQVLQSFYDQGNWCIDFSLTN